MTMPYRKLEWCKIRTADQAAITAMQLHLTASADSFSPQQNP